MVIALQEANDVNSQAGANLYFNRHRMYRSRHVLN